MAPQVDLKNIETWLPSPSFMTSVTANLNNNKKTVDAFVLSSPDMVNLLQFVSQGLVLPVTKSNYCSALNISEADIPTIVNEDLSNILGIYSKVSSR